MSISNRHQVVPFVSGESKAMHGQRLAKIGFKKTAANPNPLASVCVSVPVIEQPLSATQIEKLTPHIVALLEKAQDGIIRAAYEANQAIGTIGDEDITVEKCIEFLEEEETGGRLTIEKIAAWFSASLEPKLVEFLRLNGAKKLSGTALDNAVTASLNGYKGMLTALSGGKTHYAKDQRSKLETILAMTESGDEMAEKLIARITAMEKKDEQIAASLGLIDFE